MRFLFLLPPPRADYSLDVTPDPFRTSLRRKPPMTRKPASEYDPGLFELYDRYVHGGISRREFIEGAGRFAAGGLTGAALLREMSPDYGLAQQISPDDPRITNEFITYPSPRGHGTVRAYLVRPSGATG